MQVLVLADTHVPDQRAHQLDERLLAAAERADVVLHAGDVTGDALLDVLARRAPVHAVLGNNDVALAARLPERLGLDLDGVRVAMVHDSGSRHGRAARLCRWFPDADLVVFGHSHLPEHEVGPDGQQRFNPGSPTQRRRAPVRTYGWLELHDGEIVDLRHVELADPPVVVGAVRGQRR